MNNIIRNKPYYKGVTKDLKSPTQTNTLTYTPGTIVEADGLDLDPNKDCGAGINFCSTLADALKWAECGTVVTVAVPDGEPIVDAGDKLRAKQVLVGEVVNLTGADLRGADLRDADLSRADLRGADLRGADISGANLRGADITGADLRGADIRDADLSGADLRGADITGADLRSADLTGARGNDYTLLPKGYKVVDGYVVREAE
jgi:Pentapeptide repeats (8 copies)